MEQHYGLTAEMYRAVVALVDDRVEETRVTRQDYDRLVQAQERVEGRMERVEAALEQLVQAQARTDAILHEFSLQTNERLRRIEEGQAALQKGQVVLQEGHADLQKGQIALQEGQVDLQKGQAALAAALEKLAQAQARTEVAVGALAENVGFGLEDVARLMLPPYLHKHYGLELKGAPGEELQRRFFEIDGQLPIEIDLYGEGHRNGQRVVVLGEAKSRIGGGVVKDFADVLEQVEPLVEGEVWRVMFGYYIHPSAQPVAEEHHILLVASYQR